jgi:hypothetical protein
MRRRRVDAEAAAEEDVSAGRKDDKNRPAR